MGRRLMIRVCAPLLVALTNQVLASPNVKPFAPGVTIDWTRKQVEVETTVVLREGPLELVVCTPGTREHESILVTKAAPARIYQAMGLVGLEPGSPVRYDKANEKLIPPSGQRLELEVSYQSGGKQHQHPIDRWLLDAKGKKPGKKVRWVFAGSLVLDDGRFGADADGTVVCVVDFMTGLIAVDTLHVADNDALWLMANPKTIPPAKTDVRLIIKAARSAPAQTERKSDATNAQPTKPGGPRL
ncbi:MAG: YdjY domain-containing protein [Planctomycetota bacterium]|jgi:hypothetical protein